MAIQISRILHAGYFLKCAGTQIAFDPIFETPFSRNCYPFPKVEFDLGQIQKLKLSAVFISHFHDDHCSFDSLKHLNRETPIYIFCVFEEMIAWIKQLGFKKVHSLKLNEPVKIGEFEIIPRRALDEDVDSLFQIKAQGLNILNVVDSWIDYETLDLLTKESPWDLIMWPFQTMRELEVIAPSRFPASAPEIPHEWLEQLNLLKPDFLIPSSCQFIHEPWSWYNNAFFPVTYQQFENEIGKVLPETKVIRLNPSTSFILKKASLIPAPSLPWVQPVGPQDVDYNYIQDLVPPTTGEVAKHFPQLSAEQEAKVIEYCQKGIIEKFNTLEVSEDAYFESPRGWRLDVYNAAGVATTFHYLINKGAIVPASPDTIELGWITEVPAFKLYAAMEAGESLTSMYVRINDFKFTSKVESEIAEVDIGQDPLVRCLFTGEFGSYQKEQLKRYLSKD